jgi:hypothetical protein
MFTKLATAVFVLALVAGPSGLACQPQWVDRGVLGNVDLNRKDGEAPAAPGDKQGRDASGAGQDGPTPVDAANADTGALASDAAATTDAIVSQPQRPDLALGGGADGNPGTGGRPADASGGADGRGDARIDGPVVDARPDVVVDAGGPDVASDPVVAALLALTPMSCAMKAAGPFDLDAPGSPGAGKADICGLKGAFYWVADMAVDCDGRNPAGSKCTGEHGEETFVHNKDDMALSPTMTPFVVLPANASDSALPAVAVKPGAVVAVINNQTHKIVFAVFGDTESSNRIGAASYACAEQLGIDPNPVTGGQRGATVTYVAFTDATAVPRDIENQTEARQLGQRLAAKLIADNK